LTELFRTGILPYWEPELMEKMVKSVAVRAITYWLEGCRQKSTTSPLVLKAMAIDLLIFALGSNWMTRWSI